MSTEAKHGRSPQYRLEDHKHFQVSNQEINSSHTQMINSNNMKFIIPLKSMKKRRVSVGILPKIFTTTY